MTVNPIETFFISLEAARTDMVNDLRDAHQVTTSRKVETLLTQVMHGVSFIQAASAITFVFSTVSVLCLYSHSPLLTAVVSPFLSATSLLSGTLTYDAYNTHQAMKSLDNWLIERYPNRDDSFVINDSIFRRWRLFTNQLKHNTWILEPLASDKIEQLTEDFKQAKQNFILGEQVCHLGGMLNNPNTTTAMKVVNTIWLSFNTSLRMALTPLNAIADLWNKYNSHNGKSSDVFLNTVRIH